MTGYQLTPSANRRLDDIYRYTAAHWGISRADAYIQALFGQFDAIASKVVPWRRADALLDVNGYSRSWRNYIIYWKVWPDETIRIVSILHHRMNQVERLEDELRRDA